MQETIETTVYQFSELSDDAQEKAREWFREGNSLDLDAEYVIEDAKTIGALMGITIDKVYYSGFWSQGDGACFTGSYRYKPGSMSALVQHLGADNEDREPFAICKALFDCQKNSFYCLTANVSHRGHYYHEMCTDIEVTDTRERGERALNAGAEDAIKDALRDFMRWVYRRLESEQEYRNSDECVDEDITANEYTFTIDGKREG